MISDIKSLVFTVNGIDKNLIESKNSAKIEPVVYCDSGPEVSRYKVFNFSVSNTHTYIANGMRVHNNSLTGFEIVQKAIIQDIIENNGKKNI